MTSDAYAGDAALKAAIVEYIGSAAGDIAESGLAIGETVYYNRLMCPVNNTPGVVDFADLAADAATGALASCWLMAGA